MDPGSNLDSVFFLLFPFVLASTPSRKLVRSLGTGAFQWDLGAPRAALFGERRGMEPLLVMSLKQTGPLGLPISISCLNVLLPEINTEPTGKGA